MIQYAESGSLLEERQHKNRPEFNELCWKQAENLSLL